MAEERSYKETIILVLENGLHQLRSASTPKEEWKVCKDIEEFARDYKRDAKSRI